MNNEPYRSSELRAPEAPKSREELEREEKYRKELASRAIITRWIVMPSFFSVAFVIYAQRAEHDSLGRVQQSSQPYSTAEIVALIVSAVLSSAAFIHWFAAMEHRPER